MPDTSPPPVDRARVRRHLTAALASLAVVAGSWLSIAAPPAAAAAPSPGCVDWNAIGPEGGQSAGQLFDGPYFEGETLEFTIDPVTSPTLDLVFDYGAGVIHIGTNRDPFSFVVPKPIEWVFIGGNDNDQPGLVTLRDFVCIPAAVGPGPLVKIDKTVSGIPAAPWSHALDVIAGSRRLLPDRHLQPGRHGPDRCQRRR